MDDRSAGRRALQVISNDLENNVLRLDSAADAHRQRHLLISEAIAIEAEYGSNPYSDYVRKYHRRPTRDEAVTIGRLLGGRVRADDGSMQPPLSEVDRDAISSIKKRRSAASRRYDQIMRLRMAITALAANRDDPADIIAGGSMLLKDEEIDLQLPDALEWLTRFAKEWENRVEKTCPGSQEPDGGPQVPHGGKGRNIRINSQ